MDVLAQGAQERRTQFVPQIRKKPGRFSKKSVFVRFFWFGKEIHIKNFPDMPHMPCFKSSISEFLSTTTVVLNRSLKVRICKEFLRVDLCDVELICGQRSPGV